MNIFSISNVFYDGSSGDLNPLCTVVGTVNSRNVYTAAFFHYLWSAISAGQVQQALTAVLFNEYASTYGYQMLPWPKPLALPTFPPSNAVATHAQGPYPVAKVVLDAALIGAWIA